MADKRVYQVQVTFTTEYGTATYNFSILAETKYEAIERAVTRYRDIQPDREYYRILSGWDMDTARTIGMLSAKAYLYTINHS